MTAVLVTGIGELTTQDPAVGTLADAAVVVEGGAHRLGDVGALLASAIGVLR